MSKITIKLEELGVKTTFEREMDDVIDKSELLQLYKEAALAFGYQINELIEKE